MRNVRKLREDRKREHSLLTMKGRTRDKNSPGLLGIVAGSPVLHSGMPTIVLWNRTKMSDGQEGAMSESEMTGGKKEWIEVFRTQRGIYMDPGPCDQSPEGSRHIA